MTNNDKYNSLILDIAALITDNSRKNYLLTLNLERAQEQLECAERILSEMMDANNCKCEGGKQHD